MSTPLVTAMACVTISCPEPDRLLRLITDLCGWEVFCATELDSDLEQLWGIRAGSAGRSATIVRSPGSGRGMIRVVEGAPRRLVSPFAQRWSGVEIVVSRDLTGLCQALDRHPDFRLRKAVGQADFTDADANVHDFFHGTLPGAGYAMFTMAVTEPASYDFPSTENHVGHIFDVHLNVDSQGESRRFYAQTLGMERVFDANLSEGIFYDAWDLDPSAPDVRMSIFKGDAPGFGEGGIEMRCLDRTLLAQDPPSLASLDGGCCLTTFTTEDINAAFHAVNRCTGATLITEPKRLLRPPYDHGRAFAFLAPDGERVEIAERWQR